MEVQEFIEKTLRDIFTAVKNIESEEISSNSLELDNSAHTGGIQFDLAVSAETSSKKGSGASIKVLDVLNAGVDKAASTKQNTVSRVKFTIKG